MEDQAYARELFAILTGPPDPSVPPGGLQPDWIDRHSGFGTEIRVSSIDVVPGLHGVQIEVGFVLEVPEGRDVPPEGSFLLPVDREWRELSGFAEPEDYAPRVASAVEQKAGEHVRAHSGRRTRGSYDPPDRDAQHAMLLSVLGRYGEVEEERAGRYVVRRAGRDDIVVVLSADEWEQVLRREGPPHDDFDSYEERFASTPREERFLVFWDGHLTSSVREELPPVKRPHEPMHVVKQRIAEARASRKDFGWFAYMPLPDGS